MYKRSRYTFFSYKRNNKTREKEKGQQLCTIIKERESRTSVLMFICIRNISFPLHFLLLLLLLRSSSPIELGRRARSKGKSAGPGPCETHLLFNLYTLHLSFLFAMCVFFILLSPRPSLENYSDFIQVSGWHFVCGCVRAALCRQLQHYNAISFPLSLSLPLPLFFFHLQ